MEHPGAADWGPEGETAPHFDLKVLVLYGILRSKYWVGAVALLGMIGGLIFGASKPNEYKSEGLLHYLAGVQESLTEEELLGITPDNQRMYAPGITDELITLDDPALFQDLAAKLGAEKLLRIDDPREADGEGTSLPVRIMHRLQAYMNQKKLAGPTEEDANVLWLAAHLRGNTTLDAISNSYIQVTYKDYSKEKAQEICGILMDALVARHREVYGVEARVEEQRDAVDEAFQRLKAAESERRDYQNACGIHDYEAESEKTRLSLDQIDTDIRAHDLDLKQVNAKITTYEEKLGEVSPVIEHSTEPVYREHPRRTSLRRQLEDLRAQEITAKANPVAAARQVELDRIARTREEVESELAAAPELEEVEVARTEILINESYYELERTLTDLQAERASLIAAIDGLRTERTRQEEHRKFVAECREEHFLHTETVTQAQGELNEQRTALEMLQKISLREESGSSNLKITQRAQLPLTKVGPNRLKPLAAGTFGGLALGIAFAVLRQLLDRRVRYPEVVEKNLGLKVLGVVPESRRLRNFPKSGTAA